MSDEREKEPVTGDADLDWTSEDEALGGATDFDAAAAAGPIVDGPAPEEEPEFGDSGAADDSAAADEAALAEAIAAASAGGAAGTRDPAVYQLVFCCLGLFIATIWLPIEGAHLDLYAKDSISGGFLAWFSAYGFVAALLTMAYGKLVVWPAFFAAVDGLYVATTRFLGMSERFEQAENAREAVSVAGSGLYVITISSLLILWLLVSEVRGAAKRAKEKEEALKAARSSSRRSSI